MRPLIGITCSRIIGGAWGLLSPGHFMDYTFDEYSQAVRYAEGAPILIPIAQNQETMEAILERIDGLILTGGPDINPKFFGEQPLPGLGELDERLDRMELTLAKMAFRRQIPTLGICRGIQVMNVSLGGALYQDIPSQVQGSINHSQKADKATTTHSIRIEEGTLLFKIMKRKEIWVNGKHHQAIKEPAARLLIGARAPDGIIESVEHAGRNFFLGVQWHPEGTWREDSFSKKLFWAFVRAASDYQKSHPRNPKRA